MIGGALGGLIRPGVSAEAAVMTVKRRTVAMRKRTAADDVVGHLAVVLQPGDMQGDDVVEDEDAEAGKVEDVSEQNCAGDDGDVGVQAKPIDVAGDERDEAHGDGTADSVAAGSDEHAEVGREHEASWS